MHTSPLGAVGKGLVAGAIGSGAMTAYQTAVMKLRDGEGSDMPARVGKRVVEGVFRREVPDERMGQLNSLVHWSYGTAWGAVYGIVQSSVRAGSARHALLFGALVWAVGQLELPAMKLAPPPWEYPPQELLLDASYHLVYGVGVAGAYAVLDR